MTITFAPSPCSTVGIEWELALIDQLSGELVNIAPLLLEELAAEHPHDRFPHFTGELLQNTIELVTAPHQRVRDAAEDLRTLARTALHVADVQGASLIGSGSHPFSRWDQQLISGGERYERFIEKYQWWGRNMLIWGVHVHVGIDRKERVAPLLNMLLTYLPHLLALSASSPFWAGEATGYASNRTLRFQQLPTAGLPWEFDDWADIEGVLTDLSKTGVIAEPTEARWDVRPAPHWGTIEIRACDGVSTLQEIGAIAAVAQCLVEHHQTLADAGEALPRLRPWFLRENKWRAARYGIEATIIIDNDGTEARLRDELERLVHDLGPVADRLDCADELSHVHRMLEHGTSADRQLAVFNANGKDQTALRAVARSLAEEFADGL